MVSTLYSKCMKVNQVLSRYTLLTSRNRLLSRSLIVPVCSVKDTPTFKDVLADAQSRVSVDAKNQEHLMKILPPSQDSLPQRTMADSFLEAIIPIGSNSDVRLKYTSHIGGARLGRFV